MGNSINDEMLNPAFHRTALIFGTEGLARFNDTSVAVVGLGGVGSAAAELLIRSGIGTLKIIDFDRINTTNINRQLPALTSTVGEYKCDVLKARLQDINPSANIIAVREFCAKENRSVMLSDVDFIVDAIDSLGPKSGLLEYATLAKIRIISCMGAANRIDPSHIDIADIEEVRGCPLANRIKKYLRKRGIERGIPVVYSTEQPVKLNVIEEKIEEPTLIRGRAREKLGSTSYLPTIVAGWAVSYLLRNIAFGYSLYKS